MDQSMRKIDESLTTIGKRTSSIQREEKELDGTSWGTSRSRTKAGREWRGEEGVRLC